VARRHGAGAAVFAALGVFYWTAHSMMRPLVDTYVLSLGGTEVDASIALASFSIFPTVLAVLIGGFVDSWGGRPLLIAGGSLMLTGGALMVIPDLTTVVISQVLLGLGTLCVWVSLQASITSATGGLSRDDRARRIATFTVFVSFGQMVGPAVGGALQSLGGYVVAYSAYATLSLALLIVAIAAAPRSTVQRQGRGNLYVHLDIQTPTDLSDEQADLLRQLAEMRGEERPEARLAPLGGGVFARLRDAFMGRS